VPPPAKKEEPLPPPKKEEPKPAPKKEGPEPLPRPLRPRVDEGPEAEYDRLLAQGREAFVAFEYGRAAMRFRRAALLRPREALPHFLLAQTLLALGKYHEARDAIHAGLALRPDWPNARFQPLELYGPHVADYPDHLATLEATLLRHPNDPVLLFLYAYQLWFDGRKDEAGPLFRRALPGAADPAVIDRFLRALPPAPVL
jgi:tetratricopeptide (TPR) repeat protein